jgi:hypothetical protein
VTEREIGKVHEKKIKSRDSATFLLFETSYAAVSLMLFVLEYLFNCTLNAAGSFSEKGSGITLFASQAKFYLYINLTRVFAQLMQ